MGFRFHGGPVGRFPRRAHAILYLALLALNGGCPNTPGTQPPPDNGNGDGNTDGEVTTEIISPTTGFGMSALDLPVSVLYSVDESASDVRGFRLPVADSSLNSAAIGDRVIVATGLVVGERRAFSFDPAEAGVGFFRVGIVFELDGVEEDAESQAVIQVQGSPDPTFIQPGQALLEVEQGTDVFVSFDIRDPEGDVQWRLFYLRTTDPRNTPPDNLGTALATGSGNVGTFVFSTNSLDLGDYQLGISATDSGLSISATVANGDSDRIVTIPRVFATTPVIRVVEADVPMPPTITITAPGTSNVTIQSDQSFTIRFNGQINEPGAGGTIEVFYDGDNVVGNGFATIAADLPVSTTSVLFPAGVPEGTYFIGAMIWDGINPAVTTYAVGKIIVTPAD